MIELAVKVSHTVWRMIVKRERRRRLRQQHAKERDLRRQEEEAALMADPTYVAELKRLQAIEAETQRLEEEEARRKKEEWQLRGAALHSQFLHQKEKRLRDQELREKQEALIRKEWEEKLQKEMEEEEKKKEEQEGEETQNPEPPAGYSRTDFIPQKREECPFFARTGACRFGIKCSREHNYPESSQTILLPNMYTYLGMEHVAVDDQDADIALEYSESEIYQHFRDFFEDTLPEFQRFGNVIQYKVCSNASTHLHGNVYVQYSREEDAKHAQLSFNGRWYGGRQLTCIMVNIERWKSAVCGLYWRKCCPKGGQCNLLHVYRNPGNAFWRADQDLNHHQRSHSSLDSQHSNRSHSERSTELRGSKRSRSRSRSDTRRCRRDEEDAYRSRNSCRLRSHSSDRSGKESSKSKSEMLHSKSKDRLRRSRSRERSESDKSKDRLRRSRSSERSISNKSKDRARQSRSRETSESDKSKDRLRHSRSEADNSSRKSRRRRYESKSKDESDSQRSNNKSKRDGSMARSLRGVKEKESRSGKESETACNTDNARRARSKSSSGLWSESSDETSATLQLDLNAEDI